MNIKTVIYKRIKGIDTEESQILEVEAELSAGENVSKAIYELKVLVDDSFFCHESNDSDEEEGET